MTKAAPQSVSGRVDAAGHLISADPPLLALHLRAGGTQGGVIAVPQLATIVRLAQNLGILVSRNVLAADGDSDLDLLVRAKPEGHEIALSIGGWETVKRSAALLGTITTSTAQEWLWACDATLKMTQAINHPSPASLIGLPFDHVFGLVADEEGHMPILGALAARHGFTDQPAHLCSDEETDVRLSGLPIIDAQSGYQGWRGRAVIQSDIAVTPSTDAALPPFKQEPSPNTSPRLAYAARLNAALRPSLETIITEAAGVSSAADGVIEPHYVDYAHDISAAARHLLGLVDDLSDLQIVEEDHFRIAGEPTDVADVARRATNLLKVRASDQKVRIEAPFDDESLMVMGDFRRLLQILVNLIGNALRYSPPNAVVWVRLEQEGDLAAIVVADQGKGIAADQHDHIFEKFARLDVNEPGGTGLGLYISQRLARAMGGDISVDSAPGQGARFVLTLPLARA